MLIVARHSIANQAGFAPPHQPMPNSTHKALSQQAQGLHAMHLSPKAVIIQTSCASCVVRLLAAAQIAMMVRSGREVGHMTEIFIDADACPVREEVFRVAGRLGLIVHVVSNGSRPIRPPGHPNIRMVIVTEGADIPLASRCLARGGRALSHTGHVWTPNNIGSALAGREIARHMRESGIATQGPAPLDKAARSAFLSALDTLAQAAIRAVRPKASS
jgi:uncharacterized protein YaiI (UPF0178 family)